MSLFINPTAEISKALKYISLMNLHPLWIAFMHVNTLFLSMITDTTSSTFIGNIFPSTNAVISSICLLIVSVYDSIVEVIL